jgi:hypothetical protein
VNFYVGLFHLLFNVVIERGVVLSHDGSQEAVFVVIVGVAFLKKWMQSEGRLRFLS